MTRIIEIIYRRKLNKRRLIKYLETKVSQNFKIHNKNDETIVSCVQREIKLVNNVEEYIDLLEGFVLQAAERNSSLVAFPEYNFFDLLGLLPGFKAINRYLNSKAGTSGEEGAGGQSKLIHDIFYSLSKPIQEAIELIMCFLARKYGLYIYTGSYFIREGKNLYNGGSVISPKGEILGTQMKLHITDFEEQLGLTRGRELKAFDLDIGRICCPVCMDATYYETFRLARNLGCDMVILPIANNEEYNLYRALRGIWPRVQESYVYGIKPSLNGWLFGMHFTGKAGIFAPVNLTKNKNGLIAISRSHEGNNVITAKLDIEALYILRENDEYVGDINPRFEKDYYISTYKGG